MYSPSTQHNFCSVFRSSGVRFFQVLLLSLSFRSFNVSLSMLLSLSSCLSSIAAISIILNNFDYILTLSLQLLFQVYVFSFKVDPNASISREISFRLPWGFELFHLSCELCPASSTASVVWIWNTTLSLTILDACR